MSLQGFISYVHLSDSFHYPGHKSVGEDPIFEEPNDIPLNRNREILTDQLKALENLRHKNINRLMFAQLNINSLRDVLSISETKINSSFP